ncbi:MAG: hypothetical protein ACTHMS_19600 [Jatrophihabitans sp.]|uniref:hypothetical protein n=1 Tax=Jatrophihabitans sp. TaxID=1932789 RepID=UPI003F7FDAB3
MTGYRSRAITGSASVRATWNGAVVRALAIEITTSSARYDRTSAKSSSRPVPRARYDAAMDRRTI